MLKSLITTTEHALYSPSSAERWLTCTASIDAIRQADLPDTESNAAREGTVAHALLETALIKGMTSVQGLVGTYPHPDIAIDVDADMAGYIDRTLQHLFDQAGSWGLAIEDVMPEVRLAMTSLHPRDAFGTMDALILDPDNKRLYVGDLKYGFTPVPAQDNPQLMIYGIGVLDSIADGWTRFDEVYIDILQPRIGGFGDPVVYTVGELKDFAIQAKAAIDTIETGKGTVFRPSEKACMWCPLARHGQCETYDRKVLAAVAEDFIEIDDNRTTLADKMQMVRLVKQWVSQTEAAAATHLKAGGSLPGFKLVRTRTHRKWENMSRVLARVKKLRLPAYKVTPRTVVTPAAMKKLVGQQLFDQHFEELVTRPLGSVQVASADDDRDEVIIIADNEFDT